MTNEFYFNNLENSCVFGNNQIELTLEKAGGKVLIKNLKNKKTSCYVSIR